MKNMTIDDLGDKEQELLDLNPDINPMIKRQLINVYEHMLILMRRKRETQTDSYVYIKRKVVTHLIQYGAFLKSEDIKNFYEAETNFKLAIKYEPNNPIAYYRLGFIKYKNKSYSEAAIFFDKSLLYQKLCKEKSYLLNEQQEKNAYLYLTNSGLHIAQKGYEEMKEKYSELPEVLKSYQVSDLYSHLEINNQYLVNRAFRIVTPDKEEYCSKVHCEKIIRSEPKNTIILYFNERVPLLCYNGDEIPLLGNRPDILRHLLTKTSLESPATILDMTDYFLDNHLKNIKENTYVTAINRLRSSMREVMIPEVIKNTRRQELTAYYFDQSVKFMVMSRIDEETSI